MERIRRVLAGPWTPPELGKLPYLPGELTPVWELLADRIQ